MPVHVGGQRIAKLYKGTTAIARAYRGATKVFEAAIGEQAFPVVEATNTYNGGLSSSHNVSLPANIQAGDLLLVPCAIAANQDRSGVPAGWSELFNAHSGSTISTHRRLFVFFKTASGGEGSSVSVSLTGNSYLGATSYRISGWQGTPEAAAAATGSSDTPDPPNLAPSWGSAATLWIALAGANSGFATAAPENYTDLLNGGQNSRTCTSARRLLEAASEDPGTFTLPSSGNWVATTVAVRPA